MLLIFSIPMSLNITNITQFLITLPASNTTLKKQNFVEMIFYEIHL